MDALDRGDENRIGSQVETRPEMDVAVKHFGETGAASPAAAVAPATQAQPAGNPPSALEGVVGLRDTIFEKLVNSENDVVGLLAYSLSMQNKRDWLFAFQSERGRDPTPAEMTAYDIGERIERRLTTYRKLAENALSGNSSWASVATTPVSELPGAPVTGSDVSTSASAAPAAPAFHRSSALGETGGKLALAGGVFAILVAVALAARHMIGV